MDSFKIKHNQNNFFYSTSHPLANGGAQLILPKGWRSALHSATYFCMERL